MSVKSSEKLLRIMRDTALCNRCGSCAGLSEGQIVFADREGKYLPVINHALDEDLAERIYQVCSGKGVDFPLLNRYIFADEGHFHPYMGTYRQIGIAWSNHPEIRRAGSSGGILSHLLIYLLEKKEVDGVVVLGMSKEKPWLNKPFIATTPEEILSAAQSKYTISSVNEILPQIARFQGKLAYTGLPGQVQSIRLLQQRQHPFVRNVRYVVGPFYGNILHFSSIVSLLKSYGVTDYRSIRKLEFRSGEWPGATRIELDSGKVIQLKKFHANYLIPFHICKSSLYCIDFTNEFTDLSGGDAWAPAYEERGKGFSLIITRSFPGDAIFREMVEKNEISFIPLSPEEAIRMHSHGYDFKKRGAFIRIQFRKWTGCKVPEYGLHSGRFPVLRWIMEAVISFLFFILSSRSARWLSEKIPPESLGRVFEAARTFWKKSTAGIKKRKLIQP
ncbi:MAG: hypothetical protein GYA22_00245 [Bacteroidales bacterium]|nr:hypothetical protein [Bacteroidales bacterium]